VITPRTSSHNVVFTCLDPCLPKKPTKAVLSAIAGPSRDTTMLTVRVKQTPHHAFCQGVLLGCFCNFPFAFCSCLFIFCFRPLSLSFLPLSPIAYLLFPFFLIFPPRGRRCFVSSVLAFFHEYPCMANIISLCCCYIFLKIKAKDTSKGSILF
jgi:hypothetical protein